MISRREFIQRTAAAAVLPALGSQADEPARDRPSSTCTSISAVAAEQACLDRRDSKITVDWRGKHRGVSACRRTGQFTGSRASTSPDQAEGPDAREGRAVSAR
jgi:hypothetical protein